ncbi:MAG: hypothetical protein AVDCRST_MAG64-1464 [uncultured Phycisphaerae bacterium]|uniref:Uncharacterized protein n=1 Tax=uncultured Phycisphaerae bacterium TaxID=904963 RepID=A0A6J4NVS9_9BACT|nr:MAG: hypothetical protein AVDCRST_MAG64-1464 [uncultured Phycisphaerae bacterium]
MRGSYAPSHDVRRAARAGCTTSSRPAFPVSRVSNPCSSDEPRVGNP